MEDAHTLITDKKMHTPQKSDSFLTVCQIAEEIIGRNNIQYIFEFGARYGEDTAQFAERYPEAKIFSFECNPNTREICQENLKKYPNVIFSNSAVADSDGEVTFYPIDKETTQTTWVDGNQGASSLLKASGKYPVEEYIQTKVTVKATTLETVMKEYKIPYINILWMDVQGAEELALSGLGKRIADVQLIFTEVNFFEIYKDQPLFDEVKNKIESEGFVFAGVRSFEGFSSDALFVNSRLGSIALSDFTKYGFSNEKSSSKSEGITSKLINFIKKRLFSRV